ncbi:hypothetical protein CKM354_001110800 [Cercospora kikuchii]|uniref:Myb-like domain-containing protein n=1 Tax=Cercospora kikuchii TaxID=84275 RepID=A0A9P3FHS1_9PEZI|nr:uncharacterized protein CKM354_001110800 [Cercospora kikuchii]GIZ48033.1 hypothetical protein CKM354_001110800 [Cercospora kikuchii]
MVLFSSAAPGKKAAPKAAPRRRPQPTQTAPSAQPPPSPAQLPTNAQPTPPPTQPTVQEDASTVFEVSGAKDAHAPAPEPSRAADVEQARPESAQEVAVQPPAPLVEKAPTSTPTSQQLSTSAPTAVGETVARSTSQTQVQSVPPLAETGAQPAEASRVARDVETTSDTAIAGAQQRFEDYYVSQESAATVETAPAAPLNAPKTKKVVRLTSPVREADTEPAPIQKPKPASKRKAKAAASSTSDAPRPAKRTRRAAPANASTTPDVEIEQPSATPTTEPAREGDVNAAAEEEAATPRRRQPSRKAARTKRKSNAKSAETIVNSDDENEGAGDDAVPTADEHGESDAEVDEAQPKRKRQKRVKLDPKPSKPRRRKRKVPRPPAEGEEEDQQEEDDGSDPELHEIDPNAVSMWDLSRDAYHGKMSERGKALEAIDWKEEKAKRRAAAELIASGGQQTAADNTTNGTADGVVQSTEGSNGVVEGSAEQGEQTETADPVEDGTNDQANADEQPTVTDEDPEDTDNVGFMMDEDGNIVVDPKTMVVDRQAEAVAAAAADRPVEEINDLTTFNNRTTWINENRREPTDRVPLWKWKSDPWTEEETDEFYDALRMFGTDFLIISKMFPPKTRRMIKAKFTREEKLDPERINRALNGQETRKLDLEYYAQKTSREVSIFTKYNGLEDAQEKINMETSERHAELATAAAQEEQREAEKRLQESLQKSKQGKKTRKSKKSKMGGMGGFGGGGGPEDED